MNSYHVLELVGEGSFGRVYKGRKRFTGQVVALKFIPKVGRSEKELRSLKREIDIMRGLQHPNIVQMFDSFETDKEVVVVTEYAEGELFQILEDDGQLPETQVQEIACQLVSALYYLHSHRILHRDMKPQNILLGKCGVVKLCDFGFARSMSVSTLVLTSIKGTPLYMSPELVEEKPYDHTADLWSLGCILYELRTGVPPFYTNSIFQLVQLIVRDPVKWPPDAMSATCMGFLKGLLTKDPQKRLSWPELLHHPFVAHGVIVLPGDSVFSPLTVAPSPDVLALKHQQLKEKSAGSGKNRLLRKVLSQRDNNQNRREGEAERAVEDPGSKRTSAGRPNTLNDPAPPQEKEKVKDAAKMFLNLKKQAGTTSRHRGQISRDYEQEFPSVEVGPRFVRNLSKDGPDPSPLQEEQTEVYWRRLALETEPGELASPANHHVIIPQVKNKLLAFKSQLLGGILKEAWQILLPLRVVSKLLLNSDPENSLLIGCELGLPHLLFDLTSVMVDKLSVIKEPWIDDVLSQVLAVLLAYWDRHAEWTEVENSLEELMKPVLKILSETASTPSAAVAASVLSMFTHHGVCVDVDIRTLSGVLQNSSLDSKPQVFLPPGWGICDGLLSLLLHSVSEPGKGSPSTSPGQEIWCDLWRTIGNALDTQINPHFCSTKGLHSFLSAMLCVFTKDPGLCPRLFADSQSECIHTLGLVLRRYMPRGSDGTPTGVQEEDLDDLLVLSCLLLCFPFSLDLSPTTRAKVLDLYDRCGVVKGLLQMIQSRPPSLLELPLSLLSRLLLCDPGRFVPLLTTVPVEGPQGPDFFFRPAGADPRQPTPTIPRGGPASSAPRTASSLLGALLQGEGPLDATAAVELLVLLAQVARRPPPGPRLQLDAPVLRRALGHPHDQVRAAACSLLGSLNPFGPAGPPALGPGVFREMADGLRDPCGPVRRTACLAVGSWLGFIGEAGLDGGGGGGGGRGGGGGGERSGVDEEPGRTTAEASSPAPGHRAEPQGGGGGGWAEESSRAAPLLLSLVTDPDALTRRHSCAALGNLGGVHGASGSGAPAATAGEADALRLLLAAACTDPHGGVRRTAIAALSAYSQREAQRQVLVSLDAYEKVLQASHTAPPHCDYRQLIHHLK
ncbi:serine/threonine-protein kinase 36 [Gadus morhua]|nr:serine/threonine-protein kinase 36 [Gadus morhua]